VRGTAAPGRVTAGAASSVIGVPGIVVGQRRILSRGPPIKIIRTVIGRTEVDVLHEWNDRDIDVAIIRCGALQLGQQTGGRGLERADLAVVGHGAGIVEHQCDAQT
jgi:hypothetical protein